MLALGVLPALLILYIQRSVRENPGLGAAQAAQDRRRRPPPPVQIAEGPLGHAGLRRAADDLLQLLQPRHPGPLSDLPAGAAQVLGRRWSRRSPSASMSGPSWAG